MTTASDIITGALRKLSIRASETAISASEMQDGLEDLNDLGESKKWFQAVASASDTLSIPREVVGPLKIILADSIKAEYPAAALDMTVVDDAWNDMYRIINGNLNVNFPSTLPLGSGNQWSDYVWDQRFFTDEGKLNF